MRTCHFQLATSASTDAQRRGDWKPAFAMDRAALASSDAVQVFATAARCSARDPSITDPSDDLTAPESTYSSVRVVASATLKVVDSSAAREARAMAIGDGVELGVASRPARWCDLTMAATCEELIAADAATTCGSNLSITSRHVHLAVLYALTAVTSPLTGTFVEHRQRLGAPSCGRHLCSDSRRQGAALPSPGPS